MDALELLQTRNSSPKLTLPAPDEQAIDTLLKAAMRAPDHAWIRPWYFHIIQGEGRERLGELFAQGLAARAPESTAEELSKAKSKALRAPMIIVVSAKTREHPKVPELEQVISAGCAAHGILLAAHALGFAGVWRTGANAEDPIVKKGLGLTDQDVLVGFIYLGTAEQQYKKIPELDKSRYSSQWP